MKQRCGTYILPGCLSGKSPLANAGEVGLIPEFYPWVGKIPWRRKWQPTPVFLPGEPHGAWLAIVHRVQKVGHDLVPEYQQQQVHIYNGILFSLRKEWNNAICGNMDGPRDWQTEWSKADREKQIYDITYMCCIKKGTSEFIYKMEIDLQM